MRSKPRRLLILKIPISKFVLGVYCVTQLGFIYILITICNPPKEYTPSARLTPLCCRALGPRALQAFVTKTLFHHGLG